MEDLKKVFEEKNFDEKTLELISNFLDEFDAIFGKYLSREKVIERIKNNLDYSVIFEESLERNASGVYNRNYKTIKLLTDMEDSMLKSVFFHEMIHCITAEKDFVGVGFKSYDETNEFKETILASKGITEGFTQLLTKKRNEMVGVELDSYPILTDLMAEFTNIIGEDKFFNMIFNNPLGIEDVMKEAGIVEDHVGVHEIFSLFQFISKNERDIYRGRELGESAEGNLLKSLFGNSSLFGINSLFGMDSSQKKAVDDAKKEIVGIFVRAYEKKTEPTIDGVVSLFKKTQSNSKILDLANNLEIFKICCDKFKKIESEDETREDLLEQLPEDLKNLIDTQLKFEKFLNLPSKEIIKRIIEHPREIEKDFCGDIFKDDYIEQIGRKLFIGIRRTDHIINLTTELFGELGETIQKNGYNIEELAFEFIDLSNSTGMLFNMYQIDENEGHYIGTFSNISSSCELEEYKVCSGEERKQVAIENMIPDDAIVFKAPSGGILIRSANDEYRLIDDEEFEYESVDVISYSSNLETEKRNLVRRIAIYKQCVELNAPTPIIEDRIEKIKETQESIEIRTGKKKFTPKDIEDATIDSVGIQDFENLLEEFKLAEISREEMFKKGIGYNE